MGLPVLLDTVCCFSRWLLSYLSKLDSPFLQIVNKSEMYSRALHGLLDGVRSADHHASEVAEEILMELVQPGSSKGRNGTAEVLTTV